MHTTVVAVGLLLWGNALWAQVAPDRVKRCEARLLTQADAARLPDRRFSLALTGSGNTRLRYIGVRRHTFDSTFVQVAEMKGAWEALKPTMAFFEGSDTSTGPTLNLTIARSGEPGLVRYLAARDRIPARSLEPSRAAEVQELIEHFTPEQLVLFYVTRPMTEARDRRKLSGAALDSLLPRVLASVRAVPALAAAIPDVQAYRAAFARWFPGVDPTAAPARWLDPERTSAETGSRFMNDVNKASSAFRDLYMYRLLASAWRPGARVFAEVGRDHIPAQSPALRCALGS